MRDDVQAVLPDSAHDDCYRSHCGKSVKGHEGKCGGTTVEGVTTQAACETAGGAWTTAAEAKKFEKAEE